MSASADRHSDVIVGQFDRGLGGGSEIAQPVDIALPACKFHIVRASDLNSWDAQLVDGRLADSPLAQSFRLSLSAPRGLPSLTRLALAPDRASAEPEKTP